MSEVVKRGIEAAQTDLERENAEKLWQEGILRHVPVVGTFVNWWSPPSKEGGVRGRSLNLQAGECIDRILLGGGYELQVLINICFLYYS